VKPAQTPQSDQRSPPPSVLWGLALFFLRLGTTAFGGPAAHIAMMEGELVRRRAWLSRDEFLDLLGVANLIPGPSSTELAIFIGYRRGGWRGLLLGGVCFILPAALMTSVLAWAYVRLGALPQVGAALYGVKPVIIAIIAQALWGLSRTALKSRVLIALAVPCLAASLAGVSPLWLLPSAGLAAALLRKVLERPREDSGHAARILAPVGPLAGTVSLTALSAATPVSLVGVFLVFLKVGALVFGSGYVLLAFLRADLVERLHWLTESQLLDAVAVGQVTPGPVFTTATFIGYLLHGGAGAAVATFGIFLPSFVLVAVSGPLVRRLRDSKAAGAFLDGVNVGSLALMASVTWFLGRTALVDPVTVALCLAAGVLLIRFKLNSLWLVLGGVLVGVGKALLV